MAANTAVNIALQANDWELIIGLFYNTVDPELQNVLFQLQTFYNGQTTKPVNTTIVTIATTQDVVIKFATFLYGTTVQYVYNDSVGVSPIKRIMTALRALNTADNYISTTIGAQDTAEVAQYTQIRKNGRGYIMMLQYDNQ